MSDSTAPVAPASPPPDRLQTLANVLTILVALCAIALSIWQGYEMRLHNRLSVLPHLDTFHSQINPDSVYTIRYGVKNSGLGPAVVQDFLVFQEGEQVFAAADSSFSYGFEQEREALQQLMPNMGILTDGYRDGQMLAPGDEHLLIMAIFPDQPPGASGVSPSQVHQVLRARSYVICYCSVYGEDCRMAAIGSAPPPENVCGF